MKTKPFKIKGTESAEELFTILNNKYCAAILGFLHEEGEQQASIIGRSLHIDQPIASINLTKLLEAKLLIKRKDGKAVYYTVNAEKLATIAEVLEKLRTELVIS